MQKEYVRSLFDSIAYRYDLLNHLLSGGIDLYWRWAAINVLAPHKPKRILDVATGTADFAIAALRLNPSEVVGVDISESMLEYGRNKIAEKDLSERIRLEVGEAEDLHYDDGSFDAAIVAFGVRNFENLEKGLSEMRRVLRVGGEIVILEFSKPQMFPFKQVYMFYFLRILPLIGSFVSKSNEAYRYLPDTVMSFPDGEEFSSVLLKVGFSSITTRELTFGVATVYCGMK